MVSAVERFIERSESGDESAGRDEMFTNGERGGMAMDSPGAATKLLRMLPRS